ncbi:EAL domain-containing protein [Sporosarcina sp. G11-34]|uniref:EAL domain-containing protein n=1 Tax=Sporosarcina sp. G11-34 TaxID=2849605 RepID=UPI0022A95DA6|nr:GGDEF domain-containing phosphodiesterase [Sporosarcina sp. G11-34]MCZ2260320.1 EAL domain-containing protein [Sporosarcina sp. G11-34]
MISDHNQFKPEFANILSSLEQFYMVTHMDGEGSITHTNSIFLQTSKWTPKRVLGKTLWQMFSDTTEGQKQAQDIWEHVLNGKTWFGTAEKVTRLGDPYFVQMTAIPSMQADDKLNSVLFLELDITEDIGLRDRLQQIAFIDYETGLMSRHHLETTVNELISKKESFAFVYIKIDHFYTLKDFDTSESGIEIIQAFTNRLKRFFQDNSIARVGVNEFVVLTSFGDWFIQGFLDFLKRNPIYINKTAIPLSVSGGIIRFPEDQKTYTHLMRAALAAAKDVSDQGGGKITALSKASHIKLNRKSIIDRKLITALRDNELQVVYQPQIDVSTGKALLYEALIRWNDEELGSITPDELIPIAEENGLIHEIGAFVLTESANLAAKWHAEGHDVKIAVNSSVREFSNPNLKDEITKILKVASCPASLIQLEITENFAFKAEEEGSISRQMNELQEEGIQFALDDFGTGYASFRYMQSLPISKIKIDKIFINSLTTNKQTRQLVEGMIQFGKSMDLYVIAEGVETEEQFNLLKTLGVDAVQGYYIGVPVSKDEIVLD